MPFVKLGNDLSLYLLCPFLAPLFNLLTLYFLDCFDKKNNTPSKNSSESVPKIKYDSLMLFFLYLSMTFNGIFELFTTSTSKSKDADLNMSISNERNLEIESKSKFSYHNPKMIYVKSILFPIAICAFFDIAGYYIIMLAAFYFEGIYEYIDSEVLIIQMVFLSIISKLILNYQIYMHQKISICFSIIGMIFILSSTILTYKDKFHWDFMILFFSSLSFSIAIVYEKFIMQTKGVSPYKLLFYKGIFGSIINLLYIIIEQWINKDENNVLLSIFDGFKFLLAIPVIICGFSFCLCYVLTNYHFTPCHTGLCDVISSIAGWISLSMETESLKINDNFKITFHICHIIGYIFIGLSVVIYNEIVIFYVCGMEKDTKGFIIQRGSRDTNEAIEAQRINNIDENQEELLQADTPTPDDCDGSYTSN